MTKDELIQLTIKQLNESLNSSPECFELLEDPLWPILDTTKSYITIVWRLKIDINGDTYLDPNNSPRTIILSYSFFSKKLSCYIYFRDVDSPHKAIMADAAIDVAYKFPIFNKSYRKFKKFRTNLINKIKEKEQLDYLKKLNCIFPAALDEKLFD